MTEDLNDKAMRGALPSDPKSNVVPINAAAKEADERAPMRVHSVKELLAAASERAGNPQRLKTACTTGHWQLDAWTGGMRPGFAWVVAGDSHWGKTAWTIAVADENIKADRRCLIVSAEDPPEMYGDRLLCRRARVDSDRLMRGTCDADELRRIYDVRNGAEDVPVYVQSLMKPIEDVCREVKAIIRLEGISIVFFDYLGEFHTKKMFKASEETQKFKYMAAHMREAIRSSNITGAILSQLTIDDPTKPPTKHNIRQCRDVANAADVIVLGFEVTEDVAGKKFDEPAYRSGVKYLLLDKNKGSRHNKKKLELSWDTRSGCFNRVEDSYEQPPDWKERASGWDGDFENGGNGNG